MPAVLKMLMRHASIDTTMKYYVNIDSDHIAVELWVKFGKDKTENEKTDLGAV